MSSGPTINRGGSSGDIWTPQVFIDAVEKRFGVLGWDLAADERNHKAAHWFSERTNSLLQDWHQLVLFERHPLLYLNPPFGTIAPWAKKCAAEKQLGAEILLLVPRSGSNWYFDYVEPYADVYCVGRMVFDNCFDKHGKRVTTNYPKDLILAHYCEGSPHRKEQRWGWNK